MRGVKGPRCRRLAAIGPRQEEGAVDPLEAKLAEGRRVHALLSKHLPPSTAAKLAAELTGAPRKALYGQGQGDA